MYAKYISKNSFKKASGYFKKIITIFIFKKLLLKNWFQNFRGTKTTYYFINCDVLY